MTDVILTRKQNRTHTSFNVWLTRVLFAMCLGFCSEVVFWTDIIRPLWLWLPVILGYLLASTLLLDLLVRFRVYELFGSMVLMGVFALCAGFLINPVTALANLPITLVTRVMGTQAIAGFLAFGLFLSLLSGASNKRMFTGAAAITGVVWGIWAKGTMTFASLPLLSTAQMLLIVGIAAMILLGIAWLHGRYSPVDSDSLLLNRVELIAVTVVLVALLGFGLARGAVTRAAISPLTLIAVYLGLVLWFQKRQKPIHLLSERLPAEPLPMLWGGLAITLFLVGGAVTYQLPPPVDEQLSPFGLLIVIVASVGLAWLPAVSLVLGVRGYRQTVRTGKLL